MEHARHRLLASALPGCVCASFISAAAAASWQAPPLFVKQKGTEPVEDPSKRSLAARAASLLKARLATASACPLFDNKFCFVMIIYYCWNESSWEGTRFDETVPLLTKMFFSS